MTTTFTEGQHKAGWLKHELDGYMSRQLRTVASGQVLTTGTVIGWTLVSGTGTAGAIVGTGDGAMGAITVTGPALIGTYYVRIVDAAANAGDFVVEDPNGKIIGQGTIGVAFSAGGLAFTWADGGTDFVVGDYIPIVVTGTVKVKVADPTATDGTAIARGLILDTLDTSATGENADHPSAVMIERMAVVNEATASTAAPALATGWQGTITWGAGFTTDAQKNAARAQLLALGIQVRN